MYAEYKRCCETDKRKILSLFVFRDVFNHLFNLSFHRPQKDTCQKCDHFNIILKTQLDTAEKKKTEIEKSLHQRKAEAIKQLKKDEIIEAKNSEGLNHVAVFDLQRTLPVPALSTSVAYYKRQMWVFNLCIHDEVRNVGHMFIWDESIASRVAQEIVSCLIKYISCLPDTPNKIINLYSDACGGQNRNIKVVLGLLNEMQRNNGVGVKEINLKFFVSGHSFSTCDQNFGVIDKEKKYHENIYIPDDWVSVIRNAKKKEPKFSIHKMGKEDFFSTKKLENDIVHRKKSTTGEKVEWLKICWIQLRQCDPKKMYFKHNYNKDSLFEELDLKRSVRGCPSLNHYVELDLLYPEGKAIREEKKKDLMALLSFVPPIHHGFYKELKTDNENDLGLADPDVEEETE